MRKSTYDRIASKIFANHTKTKTKTKVRAIYGRAIVIDCSKHKTRAGQAYHRFIRLVYKGQY